MSLRGFVASDPQSPRTQSNTAPYVRHLPASSSSTGIACYLCLMTCAGTSPNCDGQVLVRHRLLPLLDDVRSTRQGKG